MTEQRYDNSGVSKPNKILRKQNSELSKEFSALTTQRGEILCEIFDEYLKLMTFRKEIPSFFSNLEDDINQLHEIRYAIISDGKKTKKHYRNHRYVKLVGSLIHTSSFPTSIPSV